MRRPQRERLLLTLLAGVQVTAILDFVVLMPLGPQLMRHFAIGPGALGVFSAVYTLAAAVSGFVAAFFVDRFDRKRSLLILYGGFVGSTVLAALAPTYTMLVLARGVAGVFGGVLAANVYAIVSDVIAEERRGRALGVVMSGFSIASIFGLPAGLALANAFGWRTTFLFIGGISLVILAALARALPSLAGHVGARQGDAWALARPVMLDSNHRRAWMLSGLLNFSSFVITPFLAAYLVANVGLRESDLPLLYFLGGLCALLAVRVAGRLTDRHGSRRVFVPFAVGGILVALTITHLPVMPFVAALPVYAAMVIAFPGRMVPAITLITGSAQPAMRGSFMTFNGSVQQLAAGAGSLAASMIVGGTVETGLTHFGVVGFLSAIVATAAIFLSRRVRPAART